MPAKDFGAAIGGDFGRSGHDGLGEFTPAEVGCREFLTAGIPPSRVFFSKSAGAYENTAVNI